MTLVFNFLDVPVFDRGGGIVNEPVKSLWAQTAGSYCGEGATFGTIESGFGS